jgi:hypothetical protein
VPAFVDTKYLAWVILGGWRKFFKGIQRIPCSPARRRLRMPEKQNRCTVCAKTVETSQSICQACQESIRGEAAGKRKKVGSAAEKAMKKHGQKPPKR